MHGGGEVCFGAKKGIESGLGLMLFWGCLSILPFLACRVCDSHVLTCLSPHRENREAANGLHQKCGQRTH